MAGMFGGGGVRGAIPNKNVNSKYFMEDPVAGQLAAPSTAPIPPVMPSYNVPAAPTPLSAVPQPDISGLANIPIAMNQSVNSPVVGTPSAVTGTGSEASPAQFPLLGSMPVDEAPVAMPQEIPFNPNNPGNGKNSGQLGTGNDLENFFTDFSKLGLGPQGIKGKAAGQSDVEFLQQLIQSGMFG